MGNPAERRRLGVIDAAYQQIHSRTHFRLIANTTLREIKNTRRWYMQQRQNLRKSLSLDFITSLYRLRSQGS